MSYSPKDGTGALFKNSRKEKDTHPDYRGDLSIGGVVYEVAGWRKQTKNGDTFLSLAATPKGERRDQPADKPETDHDFDDELPF